MLLFGEVPIQKITFCDGISGNLVWWNESKSCFQRDSKAEEVMGSIMLGVKGNSSDSMISYFVTSKGVFKYNKTLQQSEGVVQNITGNLDFFSLINQVSVQSDEKGKIFIYPSNNGEVFWMDENNAGIW